MSCQVHSNSSIPPLLACFNPRYLRTFYKECCREAHGARVESVISAIKAIFYLWDEKGDSNPCIKEHVNIAEIDHLKV